MNERMNLIPMGDFQRSFKRGYHYINARATWAIWKIRTTPALKKAVIIALAVMLAISGMSGTMARRPAEKAEAEAQTGEPETETAAAVIAQPDPIKDDYQDEAECLAKLLYGYQYNSEADLTGICWCVINRTESPKYPSTIQDVCRQPSQWMGFSDNNPVVEDLYQIALSVLRIWHQGGHRPMGSDFVFMSWTSNGITLRTTFEDTARTHYWRSGS